ncbi:hypothetical protein HELRODRAFT_105120, partial [Helobdella robusta]|uniref:Uncharacterized protein n=1 Tax=Helobdella robusta TaxID=6412 RepID=T1EDQ9_HELRO
MMMFKELLTKPQFIINFITTMELQKSFTIKDKVRVASLLVTIYHDKLDYLTRILKVLLTNLISRSVASGQPKLMFRRTESVVEKLLSYWLSICLYPHLRLQVGSCMFMLYKAIKYQVYKGPVDSLTHEARYSLSEDKLLREKVEASNVTVYVVRNASTHLEPITCKLLDCDTISQSKLKILDAIYRNTPHSHKPSVDDVDLEWLRDEVSRIVMRDDDVTVMTMTKKGWRQVNTLRHYNVKDGALMQLVPRVAMMMATDNHKTFSGYKDQTSSHNTITSNNINNNINNNNISSNNNNNNGTIGNHFKLPHSLMSLSRDADEKGEEKDDDNDYKVYHLTNPLLDNQPNNVRQKVMSEVYLTRLLATKCTLQQYVDDLFKSILSIN